MSRLMPFAKLSAQAFHPDASHSMTQFPSGNDLICACLLVPELKPMHVCADSPGREAGGPEGEHGAPEDCSGGAPAQGRQ